MSPAIHANIRGFGAWCGVGYMALIFLGWGLVAGFLPPPPPANGPEMVLQLFQDDAVRIRIGMVMVMFSALVFIPFAAVVAHYLARIEGGAGVLTYSSLLGSAGNMVLTFYPPVWWLTAAYRSGRPAELVYLMNDLAWLQFIGGLSMFLALPISIAVAAFCDGSPRPAFPRWSGYFSALAVLLMLPDQLLFFFTAGPFAWNGVFGLWLPLAAFTIWFVVTFILLLQAARRDQAAAA